MSVDKSRTNRCNGTKTRLVSWNFKNAFKRFRPLSSTLEPKVLTQIQIPKMTAPFLSCVLTLLFLAHCNEQDNSIEKNAGIKALVNGIIIDGTGSAPILNSVIIIWDNQIHEIGLASEIDIPEGAQVIDAKGGTILPGFFNTHVHRGFNENNLIAWARAGVTTVRDLGANPEEPLFGKAVGSSPIAHPVWLLVICYWLLVIVEALA